MNKPDLGKYIIDYNLLYMPKDFVLSLLAAFLAWRVAPVIYRGRNSLKAKPENKVQTDEQI
jgi:hypothetical protein